MTFYLEWKNRGENSNRISVVYGEESRLPKFKISGE